MAQHYLSKAGIYAVRRVKKSDMDKLAKATGATIVSSLEEITSSILSIITAASVAASTACFPILIGSITPVSIKDKEILIKMAKTSLNSKSASVHKDLLGEISYNAIKT